MKAPKLGEVLLASLLFSILLLSHLLWSEEVVVMFPEYHFLTRSGKGKSRAEYYKNLFGEKNLKNLKIGSI